MIKVNWQELETKVDKTDNEKALLVFRESLAELKEVVDAYNEGNYSSGESAMYGIIETVNSVKHLL